MPEPRTHVKVTAAGSAAEARLLKSGAFVADPWIAVDAEAAVPADGAILVPLARWRAERTALVARGGPVGVVVTPPEVLEASDDVARLGVVVVRIAKFTDGRAYSTARRLRERGFAGEIRATGDVLLDQLPLLARCGFDAFEVTHEPTLRKLDDGMLPGLSHVYQPPAYGDRMLALGRERHRRSA
ncbi:MAG: DUF934 domain-containing protein [Hyphomicrobiaceae bacterium]